MSTKDTIEIGLTAETLYNQSIESDVFREFDVTFRTADVETTDDVVKAFAGVDAVIDRLNSVPYPRNVIDRLAAEGCRVLARCGIGVDMIDHEWAAERGIAVVNVPEYCQEEVADHAILLILALQRDLAIYNGALHAGQWDRRLATASVDRTSTQVLGLVGFGSIARRVAERANAFGMDVIATDPEVDVEMMSGFTVGEREHTTLLETADVISVHVPLIDQTRGMFDRDAFNRMRASAYLVNVSRGGIVDERALAVAIEEDIVGGAALDVHVEEPADRLGAGRTASFESPLRSSDHVLLTPHVAWFSTAAEETKRRRAAEDVRRVLTGLEPENPVNDPTQNI